MTNMRNEQKYNEKSEKIRKYFFTFAGCFVGFVALVFITDLEPKIFFTGFILLIIGFFGIIIYSFYVSHKLGNKRETITAQNIADLKGIKEADDDGQTYTEQDLLDMLNAIADKKSVPVVKDRSSMCNDESRDRRTKRNRRLDRLDRTLGTSFRSSIWSKHK